MKRRLFNVAAAIALLLCLATVTLWVRTYRYSDHALNRMWLAPQSLRSGIWSASASGGVLRVWRCEQHWIDRASYDRKDPAWYGERWSLEGRGFTFTPPSDPPFWEHAGFGIRRQSGQFMEFQQHASGITIPLWFVVLLTALIPTLSAVSWFRSRRTWDKGHCAQCGYDLRGTPDRCPECGLRQAQSSEPVPSAPPS